MLNIPDYIAHEIFDNYNLDLAIGNMLKNNTKNFNLDDNDNDNDDTNDAVNNKTKNEFKNHTINDDTSKNVTKNDTNYSNCNNDTKNDTENDKSKTNIKENIEFKLINKYTTNHNLRIQTIDTKKDCQICQTIFKKLKQIANYKNNVLFNSQFNHLNNIILKLRNYNISNTLNLSDTSQLCNFCKIKSQFKIESQLVWCLLHINPVELIEYLDNDNDLLLYFQNNYNDKIWQYIVINEREDLLEMLFKRSYLHIPKKKLFSLKLSTLISIINISINISNVKILNLIKDYILFHEIDFSVIRNDKIKLESIAFLKPGNDVAVFDFFEKNKFILDKYYDSSKYQILQKAILFRKEELLNRVLSNDVLSNNVLSDRVLSNNVLSNNVLSNRVLSNDILISKSFCYDINFFVELLLSNDIDFLDKLNHKKIKFYYDSFDDNILLNIGNIIRKDSEYEIVKKAINIPDYKKIIENNNNLGFFDMKYIHKYKLGYGKIFKSTEFALVISVLIYIIVIIMCFIFKRLSFILVYYFSVVFYYAISLIFKFYEHKNIKKINQC